MKFKRSIVLLLITLFLLSFNVCELYAYQPASHHVIVKAVTEKLPQDSRIKKALTQYPKIATWGANAPDLGYIQIKQAVEYAPWGDRFHYFKVGSFARRQLEIALSSGNNKEIAFAAGWLTHVMGDYACHGIYVNPEAGLYMTDESSRPLHKKLETMAEEYLWVNKGGYTKESYEKIGIWNKFSAIDNIPFDLFNRTAREIYGTSPGGLEEKTWARFFKTGLETGVGYEYTNYEESINFLSKNGRLNRLERSYQQAVTTSVNLLKQIESGNGSNFSDRWNIDFGRSSSPFSSLTVTVTTSDSFLASTDEYVYFIMELENGDTKKWLLDKKGHNDFYRGDKSEYYLFINDNKITPSTVRKFYLKKENYATPILNDWKVQHLNVNINGIDVLDKEINDWIDENGGQFGFDVDLSCVTNLVDTPID
ncbi:zinc dependent phospholipase C family protein [Clostridiaceae bacterium M8S5]|nr:zinc dependent phospholipase C family protein [Clostridiaceae bacterium M8S5]